MNSIVFLDRDSISIAVRWAVGSIALVMGLACSLMALEKHLSIIDKVNDRTASRQKFAHFFLARAQFGELRRAYRELFPVGNDLAQLDRYILSSIVAIVCFAFCMLPLLNHYFRLSPVR
jgi:hypothetical protein